MPTRRDGRVEPGQPIRTAFSAAAWNRAQDAADKVLGQGDAFAADSVRGPGAPYTALPCKNMSGTDVARWGVLAISGLEITPNGATGSGNAQFESMPVLQGTTPTTTTQSIAIAVEPIANNAIGMVAVAGVVQTKVQVVSTSHKFARPKASTTELQTDWGGPAYLLYKESSTGSDKWALVRIGDAGPTGVDVVTNVVIGPTGITFERSRVWVHGVTGITGTVLGTTGC